MSNRSKGVRLWLRKGKGNIQSAWIIRDGPKQIRTGCGYDESEEAERRLSSYINEKYRPERQRNRDPSRILIADVLNIYAEDISSKIRRPTELGQRIIVSSFVLENVTPHILRHTAVTWAMQAGADPYAAANFFGMSLDILQRVYGHHHPEHQRAVGEALTRRTGSAQVGGNKAR